MTRVLPAFLPFLFVFCIIPTSLYLANPLSFGFNKWVIYPFWLVALAGFVFVIVLSLIRSKGTFRFLDLLFFAGVFVIASDIIVPLDWGLLDGDTTLKESIVWGWAQVAFAVAVLLAWWFTPPSALRPFATIFATALFLHFAFLVFSFYSNDGDAVTNATDTAVVVTDDATKKKLPNIYHLVLDAYHGPAFPELAEKIGLDRQMNGFTYFKNNMSNFVVTNGSAPSYRTGQLLKNGSLKNLQNESSTKGMAGHLMEQGYTFTSYVPTPYGVWNHRNADKVVDSSAIIAGNPSSLILLATAVRSAPVFLRIEMRKILLKVFTFGEGPQEWATSVEMMEKFLHDEKDRAGYGNYYYIHLLLPHSPFIRQRDCSIVEVSDVFNQIECATRVIQKLVVGLKELVHYDDSIIIVQGDHGHHAFADKRSDIARMTDEVNAKIDETTDYFKPGGIELRTQPLLLIKRAGASTKPLTTSRTLVQLVDVASTIVDLAGVPSMKTDGFPIFSHYKERDVHLLIGLYGKRAGGGFKILGTSVFSANLAHLKYSPDGTWTVLPDEKATH